MLKDCEEYTERRKLENKAFLGCECEHSGCGKATESEQRTAGTLPYRSIAIRGRLTTFQRGGLEYWDTLGQKWGIPLRTCAGVVMEIQFSQSFSGTKRRRK